MASGTINAGFKDVTDQLVWDSTVVQKQALLVGNILVVRFQASRAFSNARWNFATIPSSFQPMDGRWTGNISTGGGGNYAIRTFIDTSANKLYITVESFPSGVSVNWCQGQIVIVLYAPSIMP